MRASRDRRGNIHIDASRIVSRQSDEAKRNWDSVFGKQCGVCPHRAIEGKEYCERHSDDDADQ